MADYIRRDLAKKRFSKRLMWLKEDVHDEYSGALLDACETDIELLDEIPAADVAEVVLPPEERTLDFPVKYTEIWALYHFCVDLGIKCTIERLHDGYAVRFPDGSDFAQHHGTYGGTEGCVEPAIGDSEFDYTAVGLNLAKELVKKHKGKLEADHA